MARLEISPQTRVALRRIKAEELGDLDGISFAELRRYLPGTSDWHSIACDLDAAITRLREKMVSQPAAGMSPKEAAPKAALASASSQPLTPVVPLQPTAEIERIFIPSTERGRAMLEFSVSVRLGNILDAANLRVAGDLHGRSYIELGKSRNCGRKTLTELRELVRQLQVGSGEAAPAAFAAESINPHLLIVPLSVQEMKVAELPVSVRLGNVLEACGCEVLGNLDRLDERELLGVRNCGRKTIRELRELLRRVAAGEFSPGGGGDLASAVREVTAAIDAGVRSASARDRKIFEQRLSGNQGTPRTLEDVGTDFKMTRERVRQIVKKMMLQIRQAGGPRLARAIETVSRESEQRVCPVTIELWALWLGSDAANSERPPHFYVRVLDSMVPEIPAWPPGATREGGDDLESEAIEDALVTRLQQTGERPSAAEALAWLREQIRFQKLAASTFLPALRRARKIIVDFIEPDRPQLRLRRLRIADFARPVLTESPEPLTPEEIIERARARFGSDAIVASGHAAENALREGQGFFLLGPRSLGLRSHMRAPEAIWPKLRTQFEKLLRSENRPVSTIEVIDAVRIEVPAGVNSYELAQIIREDPRFIDLGRRLFGLAKWGIQEREHIKDLLPRVFREAGRALTVEQALERLTRLRSVSAPGLSNIIRHHPEIRGLGAGYFGLKAWGDAETEVILRDRRAIERGVRRSEWPLSFAGLCELFSVEPGTPRAALLWKTGASSDKLRRAPDKLDPDTLLLHKTVSFELALSAIMRAFARPAPAYELQWELAAKFGELFARIGLAEVEERLARSPRFLRNAVGEFFLDTDFDLEDFDADALRAAAIKTLSETRDIADCDEINERLELQGFELDELLVA